MKADMTGTILVADDEPKIVHLVSAYLETAGFSVVSAKDGNEALVKFRDACPDCIILDINMPGIDGLETAIAIRKSSDVPIIFLTARAEETDRIVGLEIGADDYIVKPFSPRELTARVKAVLRRAAKGSKRERDTESGEKILRQGDLTLDPIKHEVTVRAVRKELTSVQFEILKVLLLEPGRVFSRLSLLQAAMGSTFEGYERTIDAHIKNIRKALGDDGDAPQFIGTVRGVGYKIIETRNED
jgi:DNA-binding response OmpR family regulator